jgi:hypothetical protein
MNDKWRVCPNCKGRATKLISLTSGCVTCQQCGRQYALPGSASKQEPRVVSLESGTLSFTADEAAELDLCLTKPQKTPEGLLRGARLLLKLYQRVKRTPAP